MSVYEAIKLAVSTNMFTIALLTFVVFLLTKK